MFCFQRFYILFWNNVHSIEQTIGEIAKSIFYQDHAAAQTLNDWNSRHMAKFRIKQWTSVIQSWASNKWLIIEKVHEKSKEQGSSRDNSTFLHEGRGHTERDSIYVTANWKYRHFSLSNLTRLCE